ncbi:hypothetical protein GCM10027299_18250 [Larkinella ripae]
MKNIITCLCLAAIGLTGSCTRTNDVVPAESVQQEDLLNETYGTDSRQKYNIYLPAGRSETTTPVLFFVYGGAWIEGNKDSYTYIIPTLRQLFPATAFVILDYRLYSQSTGSKKFPAQEQDVKTCIEKVLNASNTYKISRDFVVWGQSAGAHLAMLYAYKYGPSSFKPRAVINQMGPADMLSFYKQATDPLLKKLLTQLMGNPSSADTTLYNSSSPLKYIDSSSPPTLIVHGTADKLVPYQQAQQLNDRLQQFGVSHVYKLHPGVGHELTGVGTDSAQEVIAYLKPYLK